MELIRLVKLVDSLIFIRLVDLVVLINLVGLVDSFGQLKNELTKSTKSLNFDENDTIAS